MNVCSGAGRRVAWLLCGLLLASVESLTARAANRYFVILSGEPLARVQTSENRTALPAAANRLAQIKREQAAMVQVVERQGGRVLRRHHLLSHALFVELPPAIVASLRAQPEVTAVVPERHYSRTLASSVPYIGGPRTWTGTNLIPGVTGKGVRIGIIDSGIDYHHAMLGGSGLIDDYFADDSTIIEPGSFPTAKVAGGTDFVGDNYDSSRDDPSAAAVPDPDPLDSAGSGDGGHGTHVAGIAAGLGVQPDGTPYRGSYTSDLKRWMFSISPGVAPEAKLYALKVFGAQGSTSTEIIMQALEWAADPNGDDDTSDHLDVVNMSLGASFASDDPKEPELQAVDRLMALGCVVVVAAGNGGDTAYKVGQFGNADRAISVASTVAPYVITDLNVNAPTSIGGRYDVTEAIFTPPLSKIGSLRGRVVLAQPADACAALENAAEVKGKIVLLNRGTCFFSDKVRIAQQAGAVGVIVANNIDEAPIIMSGTGDTSDIAIPAVMISRANGVRLRQQIPNGLDVTFIPDYQPNPELIDTVSDFSARGPSWQRHLLKPDLAAPGANILSAFSGTGSGSLSESGTSMASPHVAGAVALLKQLHPDWSAEELKAVLMNTAVAPLRSTTGAPYSESRVGAGRIAVDRAAQSPATLRADAADGAVSLSFGLILASEPVRREATVLLSNHGTTPITYQIAASNTLSNPGARLVPGLTQITVPPQGTVRIPVTLEIDPARLVAATERTIDTSGGGSPLHRMSEAAGELWCRGGTIDLHLPWYCVPRALSTQIATTSQAGTPAGDPVTVHLPTRGTPNVARPLVGVFQLGLTNESKHFTDVKSSTDLVAIGAASDFATTQNLSRSRIYFALVTAGPWLTPQRYFQNLEIHVDRNNDGKPDVILANSNKGSVDSNDLEDYETASDELVTAVDRLNGSPLQVGGVWNGLSPGIADTAPFQSSLLVHSATAAQLGLTSATASFRYRAVTAGDFDDQTDWVTFDLTHPLVDGTGFGLQHTPWQAEGDQVSMTLHRSNATAAGVAANGQVAVLLVHAQATPGAQSEVVQLQLGTSDFDADGLPDDWELASLGDLADGSASDRDGDGFSAAQELATGTSPGDSLSRLALTIPQKPGDPVRWQSVPGKHYSVLRSDSVSGPYVTWQTGITATESSTSVNDPDLNTRPAAYFYRIRVDP